MALGQHNNSDAVKAVFGASTNIWSALIGYNTMQMWSRFKPTRYAGSTESDFWKGNDGRCGFLLPTLSGGSFTPSNWGYLKPRGGADYGEPLRAGDFRGYDHDSSLLPPFYSFMLNAQGYGNNVPGSLDPAESDLIS
jgi:hypothetical protein